MTKPASRWHTQKVQASPSTGESAPVPAALQIHGSRLWASWQAEQDISLAFSTYQAGKVFLIGLNGDRLSIFERTFPRCMGLAVQGDSLYLSSQYQIWRLNNVLAAGSRTHDGFDRVYLPNVAWVTGDIDAHDLGVLNDGRPVFVNTLFSCLATVGEDCSFSPLWAPRFISRLLPEDRCHLNGMAMDAGRPRFVSAIATTDVHEGWRDHRRDGGVVMDVASGEIVMRGLSMPHSPRWYRDQLWILNSGSGEFGRVDIASGRFEPVAFCPGYARGLSFHGDYALIGLSKPRENRTFSGLELDARLEQAKVAPRCGVAVVDLRTGAVAHTLTVDGFVDELFDVTVLPGVRRPSAIGLKSDEIRHTIRMGDAASWLPGVD